MAQPDSQRDVQDLRGASIMLVAVLAWSVVPLLFAHSGGLASPFLFNAVWRLGVALSGLCLAWWFFRPVFQNPLVWTKVRKNLVRWAMLMAVFNSFQYAFFSWSTRFIDISIAVVLLELWPIMVILLLARLLPDEQEGEGGYRRNLRGLLPLLAVAFAGLGFVITSQTGGFYIGGGPLTQLVKGASLALLSAFVGALDAFTFRWGRDLAKELQDSGVAGGYDRANLTLFGSIVAYAITSVPGIVISAGVGVARGEVISLGVIAIGVAGGLTLHGAGNFLFRKANLTTTNLGVNALGYLTPVLSLVVLAIFSTINVVWPPYLVIGTAAIVAANLLINFEAERLMGFKTLVVALWVCGTVVYLRDVYTWGWLAKSDGYFDVLFLSSTVFALILSFRTARLTNRTQEEDRLAFRLYWELGELEERGVIPSGTGIGDQILAIDEKQGRELEDAYGKARRAISTAMCGASGSDREQLVSLGIEADILAHSRQRGINFGEICALFIFAGIVVGIALLSRPSEAAGLTGFLVEMFAMMFPAVILFLAFNVVDLQRERVSRILETNTLYGGYGVAFLDTVRKGGRVEHTDRRTVEQWISIGVGLALMVAYAGLFLDKWDLLGPLVVRVIGS